MIETLGKLIALITRRIAEMEAQAQDAVTDLTMRQVFYLETIAQLEHPTHTELADALGVSKPTISNMLKQLEALNYVRKVPSATDGRSFHLHLTEKGQQFSRTHEALHQQMAVYFTQNLSSEETAQLVRLLTKIVGAEGE